MFKFICLKIFRNLRRDAVENAITFIVRNLTCVYVFALRWTISQKPKFRVWSCNAKDTSCIARPYDFVNMKQCTVVWSITFLCDILYYSVVFGPCLELHLSNKYNSYTLRNPIQLPTTLVFESKSNSFIFYV